MDLQEVLRKHALWEKGSGGERAVLRGADLRRAILSGAILRGADLSGADLRRADLRRSVLRGADLSGADLRRADLGRTCLDPELHRHQRAFVKACPIVGRHGGRIVYRTANSRFVGNTKYAPGHTYIAPFFSLDTATACHPRIYAASRAWFKEEGYNDPLVRCYVRAGDWVITAKGAIGCKRLRVLSCVD